MREPTPKNTAYKTKYSFMWYAKMISAKDGGSIIDSIPEGQYGTCTVSDRARHATKSVITYTVQTGMGPMKVTYKSVQCTYYISMTVAGKLNPDRVDRAMRGSMESIAQQLQGKMRWISVLLNATVTLSIRMREKLRCVAPSMKSSGSEEFQKWVQTLSEASWNVKTVTHFKPLSWQVTVNGGTGPSRVSAAMHPKNFRIIVYEGGIGAGEAICKADRAAERLCATISEACVAVRGAQDQSV